MHATPPYNPPDPDHAGKTLNDLITPATIAPNGHSQLGTIEFSSTQQLHDFQDSARAYAQTHSGDLGTAFHAIEGLRNGTTPGEEVNVAPHGASIDKLLTGKSEPDGYYHYGNVKVPAALHEKFEAAQRNLAAKDPEAVAVLEKLETRSRPTVLVQTTGAENSCTNYPTKDVVRWDPNAMSHDQMGHAKLAPSELLYHELGHAVSEPALRQMLASTPDRQYDTREERRNIESVEHRHKNAIGDNNLRNNHTGVSYPVTQIDSVTPVLNVTRDGHDRTISAPFTLDGKISSIAGGKADIVLAGHHTEVKVSELALSLDVGKPGNTVARLQDAMTNKDNVHLEITRDGRILFSDAAQQGRPHAFLTPLDPPAPPAPAHALTPVHEAAHAGR